MESASVIAALHWRVSGERQEAQRGRRCLCCSNERQLTVIDPAAHCRCEPMLRALFFQVAQARRPMRALI